MRGENSICTLLIKTKQHVTIKDSFNIRIQRYIYFNTSLHSNWLSNCKFCLKMVPAPFILFYHRLVI